MRVLVATVVHHPEDARIRHRQIPALLEAGWEVIYAAPPGDLTPLPDRLSRIRVPRAAGRDRLGALREVRRALRRHSAVVDLTVLHDPELLAVAGAITGPVIWDVHEDLHAQMADKPWLPELLHPIGGLLARGLERRGRRLPRTIAEVGYGRAHPDAVLVRNSVTVPDEIAPTGDDRVVYLGRVSPGRGADLLGAIAAGLPAPMTVDVIGPLDPGLTLPASVHGRGFVPNNVALGELSGATAGLALLRDLPNYRHSLPTKILEYLAHGLPVITTPLPVALEVVEGHDCGIVVPFDDPDAVVDAIAELREDPELRNRLGRNGHAAVREHYNWRDDSARMLDFYAEVVAGR
ncbi:MAG: glycosyltransferase family 4 protein [Acidimicrobiales bacterium]